MDTKRTENCMICGEDLSYLTAAIAVTCTYCGKQESANIYCLAANSGVRCCKRSTFAAIEAATQCFRGKINP